MNKILEFKIDFINKNKSAEFNNYILNVESFFYIIEGDIFLLFFNKNKINNIDCWEEHIKYKNFDMVTGFDINYNLLNIFINSDFSLKHEIFKNYIEYKVDAISVPNLKNIKNIIFPSMNKMSKFITDEDKILLDII